jgi:hypothetical protein
MSTNRLQNRQPTPADLEAARASDLERLVNFATGRCTADELDKLTVSVLGAIESQGPKPTDEQIREFRKELKEGLFKIARGEVWTLESPPMKVTVESRGAERVVRYRPSQQNAGRIPLWWRTVETILATQAWRLRICEGSQERENIPFIRKGQSICRPLFVRRGRSDYCDRRHAAAAQRFRHKLRRQDGEREK